MVTVIFYSQLMAEKQFGKGDKVRIQKFPALKQFFTTVKEGEAGWFGARVHMKRDLAVSLYRRVKAAIPDLVVENLDQSEAVPA